MQMLATTDAGGCVGVADGMGVGEGDGVAARIGAGSTATCEAAATNKNMPPNKFLTLPSNR
jgi:hypothetical protein